MLKLRKSRTVIAKRWSLVLAATLVAGTMLVIVSAGGASSAPLSMRAQSTAALQRVNAIRTSFQLQLGTVTGAYDKEVLKGIQSNGDPPFAPLGGNIDAEYSLWGIVPGWTSSSVQVVNDWVYHDGWQGSKQKTLNGDCTSATAPGCNGHRRAVLSSPPTHGAKLHIDIETRQVRFEGAKYLAVAALMVWTKPV